MTTITDPTNATRATPNIPIEKAVLHIGSSTFISAPSQEVWAALTNTSTWPSWNSFVPRVTIRSQPTPDPSQSTSAPDPAPASIPASAPTPTSQSTDTNTELSPILQKGTKFTLHVRMDPTSTSTKPQPATDVHALISECRAPNAETGEVGRIVWVADSEAPGSFSPSLLTAERVHEITGVEGGTEVRNWEAQVGWLVYAVRWLYKVKLQANFEMWVADLKGFVEGGSIASSS
ncbi:uncharacterized protein N7518_003063 [Penicillium psychrosexuale]|uniref:uncharacterized protein n=1 Tax=Penicillium psychrosexuale TaxID=1002107 RepID=UPI0025452A77|nr:uncharacterized protein N7518_003063 [Penicillium psychrosexuale]KAJ5800995.1 hypothetical protein N7518_003063 [Penicillium psychrosexuale]